MDIGLPDAEWISRKPGPRFVLIHGMTVTPVFWKAFAPTCVRDAMTAAYALPGHFPWTLDDTQRAALNTETIVSAYAEAIARDFGGEPVMLVGHSTGAHICLLLAAERPDLVSGLVLAGGFGCGRFEGRESIATRIVAMPLLGPSLFIRLFSWWISSPESFRTGAARCVYDAQCPWESEDTVSSMEVVRNQLLMSNPLDIAAMAAWLRQQEIMDHLPRITQPVLNIIGLQDYVVPAVHQLQVSKRLPNVQTVLMPNTGHLPMVENITRFNEVVGAFAGMQTLMALPDKGDRFPLDALDLRARDECQKKVSPQTEKHFPAESIAASQMASTGDMQHALGA